jgi:hypothetical protein
VRPVFFSSEDCLIDLDQFAILLTKLINAKNIYMKKVAEYLPPGA